jgi:cysteinyl-tRNA synthetase
MSKSLGNFFTIRDVLGQIHPEALRLFVLSKHYRSPVDFSAETVAEAERGLDRLYSTLGAAKERAPAAPESTDAGNALRREDPELFEEIALLDKGFHDAMDNDFNTAQAIGYLFGLQRHLQRFLDRFGHKKLKGNSATLARKGASALVKHAQILGLLQRDPEQFLHEQRTLKLKSIGLKQEEVEHWIRLRHEARAARHFEESDRIRKELEGKGIQLEDGPEGTTWRSMSERPP